MSGKYKLTYFNARARAEYIRYVFAAADVPFTDVRIEENEWPALKSSFAMGVLPVLEVEGTVIHQSMAIARYAARECGLAGSNSLEEARIDEVCEAAIEIREMYVIPLFIEPLFIEADEAKKEQLKKEGDKFTKETLPKILGNLAKLLGDKKYFVNDKLTYADLMVFSVLEMLQDNFEKTVDEFPTLRANEKRIREIPGIAKYIAQRPETPV